MPGQVNRIHGVIFSIKRDHFAKEFNLRPDGVH